MPQNNPIIELSLWLAKEREEGAPNPNHAVLASNTAEGSVHSRVIAIREITDEGMLFFTQRTTRKVSEIQSNSQVSLVFWLELLQREVIIEGTAHAISKAENAHYWESYPKWAQIRFLSYAPTSMQAIASKQDLENKRLEIERKYQDKSIPLSPDYCGFRIQPRRMVFYAYRLDELSDVWEYVLRDKEWLVGRLSP